MNHNDTIKEVDSDQAFLDDVLNKLYDFGDKPALKRKNKSQKKKKKLKGCEEDMGQSQDSSGSGTNHLNASGTNHLDSSQTERIGTDNHQPPGVLVVTFQDPMKRRVTKKRTLVAPADLPEKKKPQMKDKHHLDSVGLEQARLDVHRFGLTGYKKEQQREFEQERAVMLGAKPPKKECVNYVVYQQMIKDKKEKAKEVAQNEKKKKRKPRDEKQKSFSGSSAPTGQVGRFRNGMLVLNTHDMRKIGIKTSRVGK